MARKQRAIGHHRCGKRREPCTSPLAAGVEHGDLVDAASWSARVQDQRLQLQRLVFCSFMKARPDLRQHITSKRRMEARQRKNRAGQHCDGAAAGHGVKIKLRSMWAPGRPRQCPAPIRSPAPQFPADSSSAASRERLSVSFKFAVGQAVEYKPIGAKVGLFKVMRQMPEEHRAIDRRYRIKSEQEGIRSATCLECDFSEAQLRDRRIFANAAVAAKWRSLIQYRICCPCTLCLRASSRHLRARLSNRGRDFQVTR